MSRVARFLLLALVLAAGRVYGGPALEELFHQDYPVGPEVKINLQNVDGTMQIYGSDRGVIKVFARKRAYTQERLTGIKVEVTPGEGTLMIQTTVPPKPQGLSLADRSGTVDYVLFVPETATIARLELENGQIVLQGMRGPGVNAALTSGRMEVRDCFCNLQLALGQGVMVLAFGFGDPRAFQVVAEVERGDFVAAFPPGAGVGFDLVAEDGRIGGGFLPESVSAGAGAKLQWASGVNPISVFKIRVAHGNVLLESAY